MYIHPDLHLHSVFSDGSDTPAELLGKVKEAGIDIFSLTDHDTFGGCEEMQSLLTPTDPVFLGGIELSCFDAIGKYHILGYAYNVNKPSIREAVDVTHRARREKAENRVRYLKEACRFSFTDAEIDELLANKNPGKPHFAALLMKKGYVQTKEEAFALLSGYHGKERRLSPEEAIDAILSADGIPVLAHGILADGSKHLCEEDVTERVDRLKKVGLMGVEGYYSGYSEEEQRIMLSLADRYHLLISAGSDYHGKNKTVKLGQTNSPNPERMARFYRAVKTLLDI